MNDNISRQVAIDAIQKAYDRETLLYSFVRSIATKTLNDLPSVERKSGKWIKMPEFCGDDVSGFIDNHFRCSECWREAEINSWGFYILSDFCPHCGADMRGGVSDDKS